MNLFLDASVILAATGSDVGASREIFRRAVTNRWTLIATPYVVDEVDRNIPKLPPNALAQWAQLRPSLVVMEDVITLDRPAIFESAKDRPVLFSALAWADVLLTLDRDDFGALLGQSFYGLHVLRPGMFLERERAAERLQ